METLSVSYSCTSRHPPPLTLTHPHPVRPLSSSGPHSLLPHTYTPRPHPLTHLHIRPRPLLPQTTPSPTNHSSPPTTLPTAFKANSSSPVHCIKADPSSPVFQHIHIKNIMIPLEATTPPPISRGHHAPSNH